MLVKPALTTFIPGSPAVEPQDAFNTCVEFPEDPGSGGGIDDPPPDPTDPGGGYYTPTAGEGIYSWNGTFFAAGVAPPTAGYVCIVHGTDPFDVTPYPINGGTGIGGVICGPAGVIATYT